MTPSAVHEALKREIEHLPESVAREALDFVLFMKARQEEETFLWQQVEEAQAHRQRHPDEIVTATAEEWDKATAHFDEEA
jgi:hypothetical protein